MLMPVNLYIVPFNNNNKWDCSFPRERLYPFVLYFFVVFILPSQLWRSLRASLPSFDEEKNTITPCNPNTYNSEMNAAKETKFFLFLSFVSIPCKTIFSSCLRKVTIESYVQKLRNFLSKHKIQSHIVTGKNPDCLNCNCIYMFLLFSIFDLYCFCPEWLYDSTVCWLLESI